MVPKLREVHVLRDSWTKLNVHPAKIMQVMCSIYAYCGVHYIDVVIQQENVLTELYSYVNQIPPPADAPSVKCTLKYLTACSQLFEQGFLSHKRVSIKEREVLVNIEKGFCFFSEWPQSIIDEGNLA